MKCFSLVAKGYIATSMGHAGMHTGAVYIPDAYPKATPGFDLDPSDRVLKVGFVERVAADAKLLGLSPDGGAIQRDGRRVTVLRASISTESGRPVLVPELDGDTSDALVFIDVDSGHHTFVEYQVDGRQLICHSRADGEPYRQAVLVRLKPFDSAVVAVRSSQKWIFWGEKIVKETLSIRFDGQNVFYETARPARKK